MMQLNAGFYNRHFYAQHVDLIILYYPINKITFVLNKVSESSELIGKSGVIPALSP